MTQWQGTRPEPSGECWCGCGERTSTSSYFRSGHDSNALHRVLIMVYGGGSRTATVRFLRAHGYGLDGRNIVETWEEFQRAETQRSG